MPCDKPGKKDKDRERESDSSANSTGSTSAIPSVEPGITDGAHCGAQIEMSTPEINRYLYQNLVSNVESQIEHWNRKAAGEPNAETAERLRTKAEALGYALRLLATFEPEFRELTNAAIRPALRNRGSA